jgi:phosphatidate cytidylyltransferase
MNVEQLYEDPVFIMSKLVLGLLVFASILVFALTKIRPGRNYTELIDRTKSWWVMAFAFLAALALSPTLSTVFFLFLSFWAFKEFLTLLNTRRSDHRAIVWALLSIPIQYYWVHIGWYELFIIFIPVYMFLLLPVRLVLASDTAGFVNSASKLHWGLMAFVFGLSHMAMLTKLPLSNPGASTGQSLVLFLVFVTEMSDMMQFVFGKLLGKHKVIPAISPNKTWEGLLGGVASTVLLSLCLRFLTPFTITETVVAALLITLSGFLGGAVMSAVKRDFGVKDFGSLIPGHGGMIDRVDSLCYSAPLFFHFMRYFHGA